MKINIRGISDVKKYVKDQVSTRLDLRKKEVSNKLVTKLKDATPVDTGAARDAWNLHVDAVGNTSVRNDKEYISKLNAGSSKQAPAHFIEQTVLSTEGVKPNGAVVKYDKPI